MNYLSQSKENFKNKICLVRTDLNIKAGQEKDSLKPRTIAPTVEFLTDRGAKILLLSHRGRPLKKDLSQSLRPLAVFLNKTVFKKQPIHFIGGFNFKNIKKQLRLAHPGTVFLLENLRFLSGERKNSPSLAKELAGLGDFYVNDAFAANHRANASIAAISEFIESLAGFQLEKEIKFLSHVLENSRRPLVVILGGAKASDKINFLKAFLKKADYFLLGGAVANTFIAAENFPVGDSLFDKPAADFIKNFLARNKIAAQKIVRPRDYLIENGRISDIGPLTVDLYIRYINMAGTIVWNGPLGFTEDKRFARGTSAIARAIAKSRNFSVIGGGETADFIIKLGLDGKINFLSTGGGAMLEFLSGQSMPGIEALNK